MFNNPPKNIARLFLEALIQTLSCFFFIRKPGIRGLSSCIPINKYLVTAALIVCLITPFNAAAKSACQLGHQTGIVKLSVIVFIDSQPNNVDSTGTSAVAIFFTFLILAYLLRYIKAVRLRKRAQKKQEAEIAAWLAPGKSDQLPVPATTAFVARKPTDGEATVREAKMPPSPTIQPLELNVRQAKAFPKIDLSSVASPVKIIVPSILPDAPIRRPEKATPVKIKALPFPPLEKTAPEGLIVKNSPKANFVIVEEGVKDETPHTKPADILYFPNPNSEGNFRQADGRPAFVDGASIYKFKLVSVDEAKFEFCAQRSSITMALANRGAFILSVAEELNIYDPNATQVLTSSPGTASLAGAVWSVKTKVKIRYV